MCKNIEDKINLSPSIPAKHAYRLRITHVLHGCYLFEMRLDIVNNRNDRLEALYILAMIFTLVVKGVPTEVLLPYPGVSTKHKFLSRTESPQLFLLRNTRLSSKSDHQEGYALVLAYISVTSVVAIDPALPLLDLDLLFPRRSGMATVAAVRGSTCTISSQVCTMAFIKEVFPTPVAVS